MEMRLGELYPLHGSFHRRKNAFGKPLSASSKQNMYIFTPNNLHLQNVMCLAKSHHSIWLSVRNWSFQSFHKVSRCAKPVSKGAILLHRK